MLDVFATLFYRTGFLPPGWWRERFALHSEEGGRAGTPTRPRAQHCDHIRRRNLPDWKHPLEPAGGEVVGNVPLRSDRDALSCDRPVSHHRAVIAAQGGMDADGLRLS